MKQPFGISGVTYFWLLALLFFSIAGRADIVSPFENANATLTPLNKIDELVFVRLQQLNIAPAQLCSDAVFVRRVYLDVTGTRQKRGSSFSTTARTSARP